jgi:tRNA (guanine37-N1)-methyltransferase
MTALRMTAVTLFPEMFHSLSNEGVIARALETKLLSLDLVNLRDFSQDERRNVDAPPIGGGDGMVLLPNVCKAALDSVRQPDSWVVLLSPSGKVFSQPKAVEWASKKHLIFFCGRYAGFDRRFEEHCANEIISIGDFVVTGGELPAMCMMDAVARQVSGVLGNVQSSQNDSHTNGLLEHGQYTKPNTWEQQQVPPELLSGDHAKILKQRRYDALQITASNRPDLIDLIWDELTRSEKAFVTKVQRTGKD